MVAANPEVPGSIPSNCCLFSTLKKVNVIIFNVLCWHRSDTVQASVYFSNLSLIVRLLLAQQGNEQQLIEQPVLALTGASNCCDLARPEEKTADSAQFRPKCHYFGIHFQHWRVTQEWVSLQRLQEQWASAVKRSHSAHIELNPSWIDFAPARHFQIGQF